MSELQRGWYELTVHGRYGPALKSTFPSGQSFAHDFDIPANDVLAIEIQFTPSTQLEAESTPARAEA